MALGVTLSTPDVDRVTYSREELEAQIHVALGGRVAEEIVFDTVTTGAESDLEQLTRIARQMVRRWGMSERFGPISLVSGDDAGGFPGASEVSPHTQSLIDDEVQHLIDQAHQAVTALLTEHRHQLDSLAAALLAAETLDAAGAHAAAMIPTRPAAMPNDVEVGV